jgi:heptosyltransferase-2
VTKEFFAPACVDVLTTPKTAEVLRNHPAIGQIIVFDKRGGDAGVGGLLRTAHRVRDEQYDIALVPHRSLRSALLVWLARIRLRIGFTRSAGRFLFTKPVKYERDSHEIDRNIGLLDAFGIRWEKKELPNLYPTVEDVRVVDEFVREARSGRDVGMIALAPGTVWNTKRWLKERYAALAKRFMDDGFVVALVGGKDDEALCQEVGAGLHRSRWIDASGKLTIVQSAELLRRCNLLVCNDSAPMHLSVAMRTPVVAIFGATIPQFGFAPYGKYDVVLETHGLNCRPCSSHGGDKCPIKTFDCMTEVSVDKVYLKAKKVIEKSLRIS